MMKQSCTFLDHDKVQDGSGAFCIIATLDWSGLRALRCLMPEAGVAASRTRANLANCV